MAIQSGDPFSGARGQLPGHVADQLHSSHAESELKDGPVTSATKTKRKNERGVTIVLVAFSLLALLGLAALAIDIATLYAAHGEAQRAADAAALAGARMFAASGYTSASSSLAPSDICQSS